MAWHCFFSADRATRVLPPKTICTGNGQNARQQPALNGIRQRIVLRGDTDFSQTTHLDRWHAQGDVFFVFGRAEHSLGEV